MKRIELTRGKFAIVDDEDYESLNKYEWYAQPNKRMTNWYACRVIWKTKKTIMMHRMILGVQDCSRSVQVDHINGDGLDNRRSNIRICTPTDNNRNKTRLDRRNKSGYRGVYFNTEKQKWVAQIRVKGMVRRIAYCDNAEQAARTYDKYALKLWGKEWCGLLNFPQKKK